MATLCCMSCKDSSFKTIPQMDSSETAGTTIYFEFIHLLDHLKEIAVSEVIS